jgi:copper chaperone CopZ
LPLVDSGPVGNASDGLSDITPNRRELKTMRGLAYGIAAIAAAGIMFAIATGPDTPEPEVSSSSQAATAVSASGNVMDQAGTMTLSVPGMHCAFACYPKVKETLEKSDAVQGVELAEQKEEGVLDNKQVIVQYDAGFDVDAALALLAEAGYDDTEIVQ